MEQSPKSHTQEIIAIVAVLVVIAGIVGTMIATKKKPATAATTSATVDAQNTAANVPATSTDDDDANAASTATTSAFKDGSYTATGSYESPGGTEAITVKLTLKSGVVTATSATSGANDPEAQEYQRLFIDNYKSQVVGKAIDSIKLSRVSGSSLTSQGFNEAVQQIEQQAKA